MQIKSTFPDFFGIGKLKLGDTKMKKPKLGSGLRFKALTKSLAAKGAKNPKGLAAYIGIKKYGKTKMMKMAMAGKKKKSWHS